MLTLLEENLIETMKTLKIEWETIVGLMLMLKENKVGQSMLMKFLKETNPKELTQRIIVKKASQIAIEN